MRSAEKVQLDEKKWSSLVEDIKKKKELRNINAEYVQKQLLAVLAQNRSLASSLAKAFNRKSFAYKQAVKKARANLRKVYGLFRTEKAATEELLTKLNLKKDRMELIKKLLAAHSSTKERLPIYRRLYKDIFALAGRPKSIIDLGCGLNPFSYPYMNLTHLTYYAYDLNEEEISSLNYYFKILHKENKLFLGEAKVVNLFSAEQLKPADICFLFKMTDILDQGKGHKATESVIRKVPVKVVVVSFPTRTMSGKRMNYPRRKWMELMCGRLNYTFKIIEFSNELFYVIKK